MKYCKDCKHFGKDDGTCNRKTRQVGTNPVYGYAILEGVKFASDERGAFSLFTMPWKCGHKARFFEPKQVAA